MILIPGHDKNKAAPFPYWVLGLLLALTFFHSSAYANQEAGRFQFVHGTVEVVRADGETLAAERNLSVYEGDTVTTAAASSAQIRMVDDALMALRPRSELVIEGYQYNQADDDASLVNLARGGLRTVSGVIGRNRSENVKIETPVATMGIRGTDMDTFVVPDEQPGNNNGLQSVLRVNSGEGTITSQGVELGVPAGSIAQASPGQAPQFIPALPASAESLEAESTASSDDEGQTDDEAVNDDLLDDGISDDDTGLDELTDELISASIEDTLEDIIEDQTEDDAGPSFDDYNTIIRLQ
ncbi:FecR family protein [Marinospirillum celere]|uniref:FecR family protein n=1 Tax=Marinospirillum celere TaxID=1122252 RepID=A0A1I1G248_9GAMM|nr:FecR domain-containing protein [Marinospirillum celere]SFC05591.1 FecR family protein [Marinospirillum celere]